MRTNDGRVQQVLSGRMEYELSGAPGSAGTAYPAALLGDDKVGISLVLTCNGAWDSGMMSTCRAGCIVTTVYLLYWNVGMSRVLWEKPTT